MTTNLPSALTISRDSERCVSIHDETANPPRYFAAMDDTHADDPRSPEELEAHARLLAAAPKLLRGCEAAIAYLATPRSKFKSNRDEAERIIREAIKEAAGQ